MLEKMVKEKWLTATGVVGLWPANRLGADDIELFADDTRKERLAVFHTIRQQMARSSDRANFALADFVAPRDSGIGDYVGAFAVTTGHGEADIVKRFQAAHDDYSAILAKALADRLAESFAERLHQKVRTEIWGYAADERLSNEELIAGEVSRHPAGAGLSRVSGPHREGHAVAAARRGRAGRHQAHGVLCHVARVERQRLLLRAPAGGVLWPGEDRSRSELSRRRRMTSNDAGRV
jgi:hypothetical protein